LRVKLFTESRRFGLSVPIEGAITISDENAFGGCLDVIPVDTEMHFIVPHPAANAMQAVPSQSIK
jgi:hypothetical protein